MKARSAGIGGSRFEKYQLSRRSKSSDKKKSRESSSFWLGELVGGGSRTMEEDSRFGEGW